MKVPKESSLIVDQGAKVVSSLQKTFTKLPYILLLPENTLRLHKNC
jgi:hypothetical protein